MAELPFCSSDAHVHHGIQGNKGYSALTAEGTKGFRALARPLGDEHQKKTSKEIIGICLVLMEPFGHFSAAARVFCESEEGNICAHPSEVEGNGKT